jgi:hypothetical protein
MFIVHTYIKFVMVSCIHSQRSSVTLLWYTKKRFKLDPTQSSHSLGLDISKRRCLHIIYYILRIVGCGSWSLAHYAQGFIRSVELLQDFPQFDDGALWSLCFCCRTAGVRVAVLDPHTPDRDKDFAGFSLQISGKSLKATKRSFKAPKSHRIPLGLAEWDSWTYSRVILPEIFGNHPKLRNRPFLVRWSETGKKSFGRQNLGTLPQNRWEMDDHPQFFTGIWSFPRKWAKHHVPVSILFSLPGQFLVPNLRSLALETPVIVFSYFSICFRLTWPILNTLQKIEFWVG